MVKLHFFRQNTCDKCINKTKNIKIQNAENYDHTTAHKHTKFPKIEYQANLIIIKSV